MKRIFHRLAWWLMLAGVIVSLVVLAAPGPAQAATCTPKATLPAEIPPMAAHSIQGHM